MNIEQLKEAEDQAFDALTWSEHNCCELAGELLEINREYQKFEGNSELGEKRNKLFDDLFEGLTARRRKFAKWQEAAALRNMREDDGGRRREKEGVG